MLPFQLANGKELRLAAAVGIDKMGYNLNDRIKIWRGPEIKRKVDI
jgi:hypothetical protein